MLYKFRSKAAGDVIMLAAGGDRIMHILGRDPAPQGILQTADMPSAIAAIEAAVRADDEARRAAPAEDATGADAAAAPAPRRDPVSLRQRAWPLLEMIRRSQAAGVDIVWGV